MSYYDDSSLFVAPNGYKASVLFAQKPMDANGQLAFTRSNDTATRVASNGLIEKVRTNLVPYSQEFDNAAWTKTGLTISANAAVAPDGTTTADKSVINNGVTIGITTTYCRTAALTLSVGQTYVVSVYAKPDGFDSLSVRQSTSTAMGSGPTLFALINMTTGLATSVGFGTYLGRQAASNGYYRYSFLTTAIASATNYLSVSAADSVATVGDGTSGILIWGAMAEVGDVMTDYIATTNAAVSVGPVANVPRIDYLGGGCGKLLLEPQRTNSILWSEQLQNWGPTNTTVTANVLVSPDGYQNADTIVMNDSTSRVSQGLSFGAGTYTASVYAKLTSGSGAVRINLIVDGLNSSFNFTPTTEWVRYTYTVTAATGITAIQLRGFSGTPTVSFWGAQVEAGAYATSYIPTLAASVTRGADACSKTGISSLIGQTEGTLFVDIITSNDITTVSPIGVSDGSAANRVIVFVGSGVLTARVNVGAVTLADIVSSSISANTRYKMAIAYKANDFAFYVNGVQIGTDTNGTVPACSKFGYDNGSGTAIFNGLNSQALLFKTRLPNSELASMTTL